MTERKIEKKKFILLRGLPGSGKSTKAKKLAGENGKIFSTDDFFVNEDGKYIFDKKSLGKAHTWNQTRTLEAIWDRVPTIIIDNTNTTLKELKSYKRHIELALVFGYAVSIEESDTNWCFDVDKLVKLNTHSVPKHTIERMSSRYVHNITIEDILKD